MGKRGNGLRDRQQESRSTTHNTSGLWPLAQLWQQVATSLVAVVVAMLGFWLVEGREYVTRLQVREMISLESPYVQDRNMVLDRLAEAATVNRELTAAINDLRVELSELRALRRTTKP